MCMIIVSFVVGFVMVASGGERGSQGGEVFVRDKEVGRALLNCPSTRVLHTVFVLSVHCETQCLDLS